MGGGTELDLTHGAVAAMSGPAAEGPLRPVLQLADAPRPAGIHPTERYGVLLSDGVHSQEAVLAASMNGLVTAGLLRRGSVVCVLDYFCSNSVENRRVIIVIQLEILQTECTLIGSPTIYEVNAAQPKMGPYSDNLSIHRQYMILRAKLGVTQMARSPYQDLLGSSNAARVDHAVNDPRRIDAKMHQLSLNSYQGQVPSKVRGFDCPINTYRHPVQPLYEQRPPMYMNRDPVANSEAHVIPISSLSPYHGRWTIKARVVGKTELHYLGKGKVFSCDLLDVHGGQIRATGFNSAVDQFYDLVAAGNVYLISGVHLKPAPMSSNPFNNYYEIILDATTSIEIYSGDDSGIPWQKYNDYRRICEIEIMENGAMVDLLGVVTLVSPSVKIVRNALETHKRTIQLKDLSGRAVAVTLWGDFCNAEGKQLQLQLDSGVNPVLALKGGCVSYGKSVSTTSSSWLKVDPDMPEAENLRKCRWYATTESKNIVCQTIAQIKDESFGMLRQPDLIIVVAAISYVRTDAFCYPACTLMFNGKQCNRKVTANNGAGWWCKRCLRSSETCEYRYILTCQIHDHTGSTYATACHEVAEEIIGHKAHDLFTMINAQEDDAKFVKIMQGILWRQYRLELRMKERAGHGVMTLNIVNAEKLDPSDMSCHVLGEIDNLLKGDSSSSPAVAQGTAVAPSASCTSSQARLTAQTSNNVYGCGRTIGSTGYGHSIPVRRQMPIPPQATPSTQAECFRCSRGAHSPMIPVGSPVSKAPSMHEEFFRCSRGYRSPMIQ